MDFLFTKVTFMKTVTTKPAGRLRDRLRVDPQRNGRLKQAIFESRFRQQNEVALQARIHETRMSDIINGRAIPTSQERARIAKLLKRSESDLFPAREVA